MNIREEIRAARGGDIVALEKIAWRYHIGDGVRKSEKNLSFGVILLLKRGCRQFHLLMLASHTLTAKELSKMIARLFIGLNKQRNKAWLMDISHVEYIGYMDME